MHNQLKGMGVAMVTPMTADKKVDFKSLEKLTKSLIAGGTNFLVVLGTTGESVTLSNGEKAAVLEAVVKTNAGKLPVVYGLGGHNTAQLLEEMEQTNWNGVDAILSVSPYYNKPTQDGIIEHYRILNKHTPRPILLYNVPGRTGSNMLPETTLEIARSCENIIGIKEAAGDLEQSMAIMRDKPKDFLVISGDDALVLPFMAIGGDGVISVVGNAFPKAFSDMVQACFNNDYGQARSLHYKLINIIHQLFAEGNPAGVKEALKFMGVCENHVRLPLLSMTTEGSKKLYSLIDESKLTNL